MQRGLVVLDDTEMHRRLLEEAGRFAANSDAELILFSWITPEQFEEQLDALESVEETERTNYREFTAQEAAVRFGRRFAEETLGTLSEDVSYDVVGEVTEKDELGSTVLEVAEKHGCDHAFVAGQKRSPTGKALFGDVTQRVILNFDGFVTTAME
ncbi:MULTISPECIES: universal stress protein [unclassified Haladaptatus]|uniref:universal stress protein n=1 Tax=unclassified Haladaptatus TaxID=2622732 RepID=UPI00209C417D|nr:MULTISPECIES: universal stress protein [unclassified Haladaptatus]MCO8244819.1 universal stress protein [Haladaptatus sp. AB643]MCO8255669.1 universal stress protein [Haladaptatus sp. AB618]